MTHQASLPDAGLQALWPTLSTALCHDWLSGMRGGERVLEVLCRAFPSAPIVTLVCKPDAISPVIRSHPIMTSWLQRIPGAACHYRWMLPLFPSAIRRMRLPEADLLISTSHCVAKGARTRPGMRHLCYCFTPMRYAWTFYDEYFGGSLFKRLVGRLLLPSLRAWDRETSEQVDAFVAISDHIRDRIHRFYNREACVVFPPVDTQAFTPGASPRQPFDLVVSALVPYKRVDLAVRAYSRSGYPLTVAGAGSESARLKALAGPNVTFVGRISDDAIRDLYRSARLLVFPGEEDFGIVPLEAQACGCPVVAFRKGGATETVRDGITGEFFDTQTESDLLDAVKRCAARSWDTQAIRAHAETFGTQAFVDGLAQAVQAVLRPQ